jgi:hypothetical protein
MSEAPTMAEQYLTATQSRNLKLEEHRTTDADRLLAAAYATSGDPARVLALAVWRMGATGHAEGFHLMVDLFDAWTYSRKKGTTRRGKMTRETVRRVLWWWCNQTCHACAGLGHPIIEGTPVLDTTRKCPECGGTGKADVRRLVHGNQKDLALDIVGELERLSSIVFSDMAKLLKKDLATLDL